MSMDSTSVAPRSHFGTRGVDMSSYNRSPQPKSKRNAGPVSRDSGDMKRSLIMTLAAVGGRRLWHLGLYRKWNAERRPQQDLQFRR